MFINIKYLIFLYLMNNFLILVDINNVNIAILN